MATKQIIPDLEVFAEWASGDVIIGVDVSDLTGDANGTTKRDTLTNFFGAIPVDVVRAASGANDAILRAKILTGGTGDPMLALEDVDGGNTWYIGLDNSNGDNLKISKNADLSAEFFRIDFTNGRVTVIQSGADAVIEFTDGTANWFSGIDNSNGGNYKISRSADLSAESIEIEDSTGTVNKLKGRSRRQLVIKAADQIKVNDTTLVIDNDLQITDLKASTLYAFESYFVFNAQSPPSMKMDWNASSGISAGGHIRRMSASNGAQENDITDVIVMTNTGDRVAHFRGWFLTTATPPTVWGPRWAQDVSDASSTDVLRGAWLAVEEATA